MTKNLIFLILSLLFFQTIKAQKPTDTVMCYMTNSNKMVTNKESADYLMVIMPIDSTTHLSRVEQYYKDGKIKLLATTSSRQSDWLVFEGPCINYYQNGKKEEIANYKKGNLIGDIVKYYPNGKIHCIETAVIDNKIKFIECRDSTGNTLAVNGNGKWINYDFEFKNISLAGTIKDSVKVGEWDGLYNNKIVCKSTFNKGDFISCIYDDGLGNVHTYTTEEVEPTFKNGPADFNNYLARSIRYPNIDGESNNTSSALATFTVERDGKLIDVNTIRAPNRQLAKVLEGVINASPLWNPGIQNGEPVRVQFTISFAFSIANN